MYSFFSHPHPKSLHILTVSCFVGSLILLGVSSVEGLLFPMIYQAAAFGLATAGIYFLARYALRQYVYAITQGGITDAEGHTVPDLVITESIGKKTTVVARTTLRDIGNVTVFQEKSHDAEKAKKSLCHGKRVFKYINTPFISSACYISLPQENAVLIIPVDDTMIEILQRSTT